MELKALWSNYETVCTMWTALYRAHTYNINDNKYTLDVCSIDN